MYSDHIRKISEEYPYGAYCECGRVIHIKETELTPPATKATCNKCGFTAILYTRSKKVDKFIDK